MGASSLTQPNDHCASADEASSCALQEARAPLSLLLPAQADNRGLRGDVLVIHEEGGSSVEVETGLRRHGFQVTSGTTVAMARGRTFDAVIAPVRVGEQVLDAQPDAVVVVQGPASVECAVSAIRVGAHDYFTRPLDPDQVCDAVERAVESRRLRDDIKLLPATVLRQREHHRLLGRSPEIQRVRDLVASVGPSQASVLIFGESGTGKEIVAQEVHARSERSDGPFVAINCSAVPAALLESELFGHSRGAFTDARGARTGLFVQASGGTLFLDEVGEMPLEMQPKLLRALQERKVRPVGSNSEVSFDARIVCSTNCDLDEAVAAHRFRMDLYYRINVVRVAMPPLRDRGRDALLLAQHFIEQFTRHSGKNVRGLTVHAAEKVLAYDWPGNVRELENCVERAVALTRHDRLVVADLPERVRDYRRRPPQAAPVVDDELLTITELERRHILRVLSVVGGNKSRAAEILGLDRRTLYRKLSRLEQP